jgi:hypothetical protein
MQGKVSHIINAVAHFFTGHGQYESGKKVMLARSAVIFDATEYRQTQLKKGII